MATPQITQREQEAYNFFIDKFKTVFRQSDEEAKLNAAAIVGNFIWESNGLKTTIKGDNNKSIGYAQWNDKRRELLQAKPHWNTPQVQLEFAWEELTGDYRGALDKVIQAKGLPDKTHAFNYHYEVSRDSRGKDAKSARARIERLRHAARLAGADYKSIQSDGLGTQSDDLGDYSNYGISDEALMQGLNSMSLQKYGVDTSLGTQQKDTYEYAMPSVFDMRYDNPDEDLLNKYAYLNTTTATKSKSKSKSKAPTPSVSTPDKYDEILKKLTESNNEKALLQGLYKQLVEEAAQRDPVDAPDIDFNDDYEAETSNEDTSLN